MTKKIKEIEQALMVLYNELEGLLPKTHCLSFLVTHTNHEKPPYVYGFIHIGSRCHLFNNMTDLIAMVRLKIEKNRVLYQSFDGLREVLK